MTPIWRWAPEAYQLKHNDDTLVVSVIWLAPVSLYPLVFFSFTLRFLSGFDSGPSSLSENQSVHDLHIYLWLNKKSLDIFQKFIANINHKKAGGLRYKKAN